MKTDLLINKTAIITGGNGGIGKAIAFAFAQAGATVAIIGTNEEKGKQAVDDICQGAEAMAHFYLADVSQKQAVDQIIEKITKDLGDVHILVNSAGITRDALLMKLTEEQWDQVIAINLKSIYNMCHALVRPMIKAKYGKIINISSVVGIRGNAGQTNYAAAKAGMFGFSKSLAREIASRGVCVNCIAPGFIETQMTNVLSPEQKEYAKQMIPFMRFGVPEDIANMALFLASDLANYITGQIIAIDGGMTM